MNKDIVQNVVIAVIISALGYVFNSIGELKHNQDLHNSASEVKDEYYGKRFESIEANDLKQWNVIDDNSEKETSQEVRINVNANNIQHLKEGAERERSLREK